MHRYFLEENFTEFAKLAGRWPTAIFQLAPAPFPPQLLQYNMDFGANIQPGPTVQNATMVQKTCSNLFVRLLEKVVESIGKSGK